MADEKGRSFSNVGDGGKAIGSGDTVRNYLENVLEDIVSLNGLFTVAVFMGLSFAEPGAMHSLEENPQCDPDIEMRKRIVQFEIASFSCFLFSGFLAKTVKIFFYIYQKNEWQKPEENGRLLMTFYLSIYGTMAGCICLLVAMVDVVQIKLGKLSCKSTHAIITAAVLCVLIVVGIGMYFSAVTYGVAREVNIWRQSRRIRKPKPVDQVAGRI